jgi:proteasome assembly chaperone (PAC2) family protein
MYFYQGSILIFKNDIFSKKNSKIKKKNLIVYGGIVVKMDNSHLFEVVLRKLFLAWEVMDNEIYKLHWFFYT